MVPPLLRTLISGKSIYTRVLPPMTAYHTLQPLHMTAQGLILQVGDQLTVTGSGKIAHYRGGELLGCSRITRLGLSTIERAGIIQKSN